ncbi:MAG: hypothetical protein EXS42_01870 [Lacunisphaera sp.]|nr:hypothetical protein [Lacunisphaera sp.]
MKKVIIALVSLCALAALNAAYDYEFNMEENDAAGTVTGKVVDVVIHSCHGTPSAEKPGYCNGTMRVEYFASAATKRKDIIVSARIALELDGKSPVTLDTLPGKRVVVKYEERDGLRYATSVVATTPK